MQGGLLLGDPVFYALAGALLEGYAEGAVAAVTAAGGQMLGLDRLALGGGRHHPHPANHDVEENTMIIVKSPATHFIE